ncbi:nucleotidyltransferase family protein [Candidatus Poriferisodalis sp.]|uniref:nucleotidyltransferase family protein n=1 Tax=Candidatus Poriferisodalis sp. TaxID=3101277 RepID=UPI003B51E9D2
MRRVTVTIPDELETALDRFIAAQSAAPSVTAVLQASLERFLAESLAEAPVTMLDRVLRNRDRIVNLLHRWGVSNVRLFGSVARGDAGPQSDIDLLVSVPPGIGFFDIADMQAELEELLHAPVHLVTDGAMTDEQRAAVAAEALQL